MSTLKVNEIQKNTSASITLGSDVTTDNDIIMTSNAVLDVDAASSAALPASTTIGTNVTVSSANGIVCTGDVKGDELKIGDNRTMSSVVPRVGGVLTFDATCDGCGSVTASDGRELGRACPNLVGVIDTLRVGLPLDPP